MSSPVPTPPRLIAMDLDGTLLDPSGRITVRTAEVLSALAARGIVLVAATGRPPMLIGDLVEASRGAISHVVGGNGALVARFPGPETLRLIAFEAAAARDAVVRLRDVDPRFGFALATELGFAHEPGFAGRLPVPMDTAPTPDVLELGGDQAFKLMVFHPEIGVRRLIDELPPLLGPELAVSHLGADAAEIGPAEIDKGSGLAWLCGELGIPATDVWAFGDEHNDLSMLRWAGRAVVMATATDEVRAAADEIAPANSDDGVAQVLERLLDPGSREPLA